MCGALRVPVALICLVDGDRQIFARPRGAHRTARRDSPDAAQPVASASTPSRRAPIWWWRTPAQDARLRQLPAVTELGLVAYAGVPLFAPGGGALGTLCAIDRVPRRWTPGELAMLCTIWPAVAGDHLSRRTGASRRPDTTRCP